MDVDKIYLGDCIDLIKKLPDKSVDVSFTSPPYNRIRNDTYKYYDDTRTDYLDMLISITEEMLRVTKKDVIINIQSNLFNKSDVCKWQGMFADKLRGIVIWVKNNPQPSTNYKNKTYSITNAYECFYVLGEGGESLEPIIR